MKSQVLNQLHHSRAPICQILIKTTTLWIILLASSYYHPKFLPFFFIFSYPSVSHLWLFKTYFCFPTYILLSDRCWSFQFKWKKKKSIFKRHHSCSVVPSIFTAYSFCENLELVTTFLKAVRKTGKNKRVFNDKGKKCNNLQSKDSGSQFSAWSLVWL